MNEYLNPWYILAETGTSRRYYDAFREW